MKAVLGYLCLPVCSRSPRISTNSIPHHVHHRVLSSPAFLPPALSLSVTIVWGSLRKSVPFNEFESIASSPTQVIVLSFSTVIWFISEVYKSTFITPFFLLIFTPLHFPTLSTSSPLTILPYYNYIHHALPSFLPIILFPIYATILNPQSSDITYSLLLIVVTNISH